jgi:large subunit ribosomal protein L29
MKIAEIKEFTLKELDARKRDIRQEIFNLRIQQQGGQLEKPHMLRSLRRDAARVESVLTQKRKAAQNASIPVESRANKK